MYPSAIAEQLRARGHDVHAVTARPELRALPDKDVFDVAQQERRAVLTENISDFSVIADRCDERGQAHHGLIFVDPAKHPRGDQRTVGRLVTGLDGLLKEHPADEPTSLRSWL
jgi:nucleoside-diphosphate-sugar epimerase